MPVVIGGKPESPFSDPIGLLTDCHRRIERFLGVLIEVAGQARGGLLTPEQVKALETALRYFREAAPKHTADEEQTLFPRIRTQAALKPVIDTLELQHEQADRDHAEVDRLGRAWLDAGSLPPADAAHLSTVLAELQDLYRGHIGIEEGELFPAAAAALDKPQREAMGAEMAARRGLGSETRP